MATNSPESQAAISPRYLRVKEFAQLCNVSETLARRWIYSGAIPAVKIKGLVMIDRARAQRVMETRHAFRPVKTSPQRKGARKPAEAVTQ